MTDRLLGFAGVCVLPTFVPGVDTAMVTRSALARRAGLRRVKKVLTASVTNERVVLGGQQTGSRRRS